MKLIYLTSEYGGRIGVSIQYSHRFYFKGAQPPNDKLITLDLPGLSVNYYTYIISWLRSNEKQENEYSRREINEFPENVWRETVLDDYIEAGNFHETVWYIPQKFPSSAFADFGNKWLDDARKKLDNALQNKSGVPRINAFGEIKDFLERIYFVMDKTPGNLAIEIQNMKTEIDRETWKNITKETDDIGEWIKTANDFNSDIARREVIDQIVGAIVKRRLSSEEIFKLLHRFNQNLRNSAEYYNTYFWTTLAPFIKFEQNVMNRTIDLTEAVEEKVLFNWNLLNAKRVGSIQHNRNALIIKDKLNGLPKTYVSGERKLKFQIQKNGGKLEKFGCVLTIASAEEKSSIQPALLEVEKIDALANLNIEQALEKIAHLNLPPNHLIFRTATRAKTDPKQARVFADLLIELLVGVDADIARNLARAQAQGNRR